MNTITLAESFVEFRTGLPLSGHWIGLDRDYIRVRLGVNRRGLVLTAEPACGGTRWEYRGWRAWRLFERLASAVVKGNAPAFLESHGLIRQPLAQRRAA